MQLRGKWAWGVITTVGGFLMAGASVSPGDAKTTLQAWWELSGIGTAPSWLASHAADQWGFLAGGFLFVVGVILLRVTRRTYRTDRSTMVATEKTITPEFPTDLVSLQEATIEAYDQTKQTVGMQVVERMPSFDKPSRLGTSHSGNHCERW